jgi:hypothetical protein
VCGIGIAITFFFKLAQSGWQRGANLGLIILLLTIALKYAASRISVKQELEIGRSLYPPRRIPDDLKFKDRLWITIQVIAFMILYMAIGLLADHILAVSAIMTAIALNDYITRSKIHAGIARTFSDSRYDPSPSEQDYDVIQERRGVARWYLFQLPQLMKEAGCVIGCVAALGIGLYGYFNKIDIYAIAYITLIGTLLINELITLWWRFQRYQRLKQIDDQKTNRAGGAH